MMPAELHPEEMLDGARSGTLTPRALDDLSAHLARCAACRLQLKLGDDLAVEGRTTRNDGVLLAKLVRSALSDAQVGRLPLRRRTSPLLRRLLLPAACVLLGGGVATAMWSVRSELRWLPEIHPITTVQQPAPRAKVRAPRPAAAPSSVAPTLEPAAELAPAAPEPRLVAPTKVAKVAKVDKKLTPRRVAARPAAAQAVAVVEAEAVTPAPVAPPASAASLFADANRARRDGAYSRALSLYRQLRNEFAGTREEITARVIVGQLALAENHPSRALSEFNSYLTASPQGTLAEEALVGRAMALRGLGRADAERAAWHQLLKSHPSSIHAERARARLEMLRP